MPMVNDVNDIGLPHIGAAEILNWPSNPGNSNNFIIQSDLGKSGTLIRILEEQPKLLLHQVIQIMSMS